MKRLFLLLPLLMISLVEASPLEQLEFYTEEYPPYNYTEGEQLTGIAVDLLEEGAKQVGASIKRGEIQVQPWPRAYRSTLIKPNAVLFSTTRTEIREPVFQWVGPIGVTRVVVLAKKERAYQIKAPVDLAQYRIGVVRDDVGQQLLLELGTPRDSMAESSLPETLAKQLAKNRIDLWAYEERVAQWWLKSTGYDAEEYEVVYVLSEGELYYAFNLQVAEQSVSLLQEGIDKVLKNGESGVYQRILDKYR